MGPPRLALSCLVTSTSRAGGTQLCEALAATGAVGVPADYFNPFKAVSRSRAWKLLGAEAPFPERYLARVRLAATGDNGVCGLLLPWPHLAWLVRMARAASVANGGVSCTDAEAVAHGFRTCVTCICAVEIQPGRPCAGTPAFTPSFLAEADQEASATPAPDFQEICWLEALVLQHERSWQTYFHLHGIVPEMVEYEQFQERSDETVGAIIETLGLSVLAWSTTNRPSPDRHHASDMWLGQYLAVRDQLSATIGIRSEPRKTKTVRPEAAATAEGPVLCPTLPRASPPVRPSRPSLHPSRAPRCIRDRRRCREGYCRCRAYVVAGGFESPRTLAENSPTRTPTMAFSQSEQKSPICSIFLSAIFVPMS